ncbi:MAG: hypothetical protein IPH20_11400 [Bacteroidales bacterium]|nr:hypothetical protein [Bacteroidales bacterium]
MDSITQNSVNEPLSLIITDDKGSFYISVTNPVKIAPGSLINKLIVSPELMENALHNDEAFKPLMLEISKVSISAPNRNELALLGYFYLNPTPSPISLINRWFTDAGTDPQKASILAGIVYYARTEKGDEEPDFFREIKMYPAQKIENSNPELKNYLPENLTEAFEISARNSKTILAYDGLSESNPGSKDQASFIRLDLLPETGFLIEDHAMMIVGLSVTIAELVRMTAVKWPLFAEKLLEEVPLYLRDFYSLGRLITEKQEVALILSRLYHLHPDIILASTGAVKESIGLEFLSSYTEPNGRTGIPVFLRILK